MTPDEYLTLVAEYGSFAAAAVANPDRRSEIVDAAMREDRETAEWAVSQPDVSYFPHGREWFEAEVDHLMDERLQREKLRLDVELGRRALEPAETASRLPGRDPLPVPLVEKVLRLRSEGMAWDDITEELSGTFSRRKVGYVRAALQHDDLGWDRGRVVLGPMTENTEAGIVLPKR